MVFGATLMCLTLTVGLADNTQKILETTFPSPKWHCFVSAALEKDRSLNSSFVSRQTTKLAVIKWVYKLAKTLSNVTSLIGNLGNKKILNSAHRDRGQRGNALKLLNEVARRSNCYSKVALQWHCEPPNYYLIWTSCLSPSHLLFAHRLLWWCHPPTGK